MTAAQQHKLACPNCGPERGSIMVQRRRGSDGAPFWGCERFPRCKATHGAHPDGTPLGVPGTMDVKLARIRAHDALDRLWTEGGMHRNGAYAWLSEAMGIPRESAHIGAFDAAQCNIVVQLATEKLDAIRQDPLRGERDQIRAVIGEKFGHTFRAARRARTWLAAELRIDGKLRVHEMTEAQCREALVLLEALPMRGE
jgi:ssDNA-binding Zn-finger/Zn-ribbon topoisomerase 1